MGLNKKLITRLLQFVKKKKKNTHTRLLGQHAVVNLVNIITLLKASQFGQHHNSPERISVEHSLAIFQLDKQPRHDQFKVIQLTKLIKG